MCDFGDFVLKLHFGGKFAFSVLGESIFVFNYLINSSYENGSFRGGAGVWCVLICDLRFKSDLIF